MAGGFFEPLPGEYEPLHQSTWVVGRVRVLLNQLVRNTHRGRLVLTDADRDLLREVLAADRAVNEALRAIIHHAQSRRGFMTAVALAEAKAQAECQAVAPDGFTGERPDDPAA